MLESARALGFRRVAVEFGVKSINQTAKAAELCNEIGLELLTRLDLDQSDRKSFTDMIRRHRGSFDIVAGMCRNRSDAMEAALNPRIDLLEFPREPRDRKLVSFTHREAALAAKRSCALELDFSAVLKADELGRTRLLSMMRTELSVALNKDVPVLATSGAGDVYGLRTPRDLASLVSLLGADWQTCLEAVSASPLQVPYERGASKAILDQECGT